MIEGLKFVFPALEVAAFINRQADLIDKELSNRSKAIVRSTCDELELRELKMQSYRLRLMSSHILLNDSYLLSESDILRLMPDVSKMTDVDVTEMTSNA